MRDDGSTVRRTGVAFFGMLTETSSTGNGSRTRPTDSEHTLTFMVLNMRVSGPMTFNMVMGVKFGKMVAHTKDATSKA